jgi:ribonuclease Z
MTKLVYLGTSGAMPTIERGLSCTVLALEKEYIMVDCGDGSCRQYLKSDLKWNKPLTILITHMHSDHTMGILGLLQSMDLMGRTEPVKIYGVRGIKKFINDVNRSVNFKFGYEFKVAEVDETLHIETMTAGLKITMCKTKHQVPSLAYKITLPDKAGELDIEKCIAMGIPKNSMCLGVLKHGEDVDYFDETGGHYVKSKDVVGAPTKGLIIGFSGDTRPIPELIPFFKNCDYLTFETTFRSDELPLATKAKHSTAEETAVLAQEAGVKTLLANHFSARHANTDGFRSDIEKHFKGNIVITEDFLQVVL